jgi:hypothetical protein
MGRIRRSKAVDREWTNVTLSDEALPKEVVRATLPPLPANASPRLTVAYRALQKAYRAKDGYLKGSSDRQLANAATRYSGLRVTQDTIGVSWEKRNKVAGVSSDDGDVFVQRAGKLGFERLLSKTAHPRAVTGLDQGQEPGQPGNAEGPRWALVTPAEKGPAEAGP